MIIILTTAVFILAMFFYWVYAPSPVQPKLSATIQKNEITIGDYKRTYLRYKPKSVNRKLLIVLHGSGIDGAKIREWTGYEFDEMADKHGFTVVYPDGYKHNWNDIRKSAPFPAKEKNIDDVAFIKSIILSQDVDPNQVYAFGYSNGGTMIFRLVMQEPALFAGVATIAASLPTPDNCLYQLNGPTPPIMMVNGTKDPLIPYNGGKVFFFGKNLGYVISAQSTAESFAAANKAVASASGTEQVWEKERKPVVVLHTVEGGGHVIPQTKAKFPRMMGKISKDLDAPAKAISFFELDK
jgi:polyhydroxybutyrate depolymerase